MGRGIAVLDGVNIGQREEEVLGVLVLHFHNGKCHWVADGEMFPIRMRKLHNTSVRQTLLESSILKLSVYEKLAKK